jgi:hypothetical protein
VTGPEPTGVTAERTDDPYVHGDVATTVHRARARRPVALPGQPARGCTRREGAALLNGNLLSSSRHVIAFGANAEGPALGDAVAAAGRAGDIGQSLASTRRESPPLTPGTVSCVWFRYRAVCTDS